MSEVAQVKPIDEWFVQDGPEIALRSPYVAAGPTAPLPVERPSPQVAGGQRERDGFEFFEYLRDSRTDVSFTILFTDASRRADFGPEGNPDPLIEALEGSRVAIYGVAGCVMARNNGLWLPAGDARRPHDYIDRLSDAGAAAGVLVASSDAEVTPKGQPLHDGARAVEAVGDVVRLQASDPTDPEGSGKFYADCTYGSELAWHGASRVGNIMEDRLREEGSARGHYTIVWPGDLTVIETRLILLGIPQNRVEAHMVTPSVDTEDNYIRRTVMDLGRIPRQLLED